MRHGKTQGNLEGRYVGRTDEPLLPAAAAWLERSGYRDFRPDLVYASPMMRCRETAAILFPACVYGAADTCRDAAKPAEDFPPEAVCSLKDPGKSRLVICEGLRERDFGAFEYKTYNDLKDDPVYQAWIDSCGMSAVPGGESGAGFRARCCRAFLDCVREAENQGSRKVAFVTHGGVIMSIMEACARPHADFYHWQLQNGCGYHVRTGSGENGISVRLL